MVPKPSLGKHFRIIPRKPKQSLHDSLCALKVGKVTVQWGGKSWLTLGLESLVAIIWRGYKQHDGEMNSRRVGVLGALSKPSPGSGCRESRASCHGHCFVFCFIKASQTFGVTGRFYLERGKHSAPRTLCLQIKFPQLVEEVQLHVGTWSVNWQVPGKEHQG